MGIHGMGQAFNLQFQRRGNVQINKGGPGFKQQLFMQPMQPFQQTTSIEIQNGPGGFWGGLAGFLDGIGNIGGCGGCGGGSAPAKDNRLANLEKLGPDWKIVDNEDGTFTAARDGYESKTGNYETVRDHIISGKKPEAQGTPPAGDTPPAEDSPAYKSPGGDDWSAAKADDLGDGAKIQVHDDLLKNGDINGETKISSDKASDGSGYPKTITVKGYSYEYIDDSAKDGVAKYRSLNGKGDIYRLEKNGNKFGLNQYSGDKGAGTADISSRTSSTGTSKASTTGADSSSGAGKVKVPFNWSKVNQTGQHLLAAGLSNGSIKTAADVAKWLKTTQPGQTIFQDQLIKNNPSIFDANGNVKPNADFSKLDIPNGYSVMVPSDS